MRALHFLSPTIWTVLHVTAVLANTKVLTGGTIIAYDEGTKLPKVIRGDPPPNTSISNSSSTEVIDCTNKIITPGFIDTHRHGWQTVFKTMGSNTTLGDYGFRYSALVAQPLFTPEDIYISQKAGIFEALNAGTTTILDHAHHTWTREHAAAGYNGSLDSGARVYFAYTFQTVAGFSIQDQLRHWRELDAAKTSNLTSLAMSYDDFTANPLGKDTQDIVKLAKEAEIPVFTSHHVGGPWNRMYSNTVERWQIPNSNPFSVAQAFLLATRNGGLALGRKDLGVITERAKADILVWDGRSPSLLGWADPIAAIMLHASIGDIDHVLVDGEFVKRDRKLTVETYDEDVYTFLSSAKRIQEAVPPTTCRRY